MSAIPVVRGSEWRITCLCEHEDEPLDISDYSITALFARRGADAFNEPATVEIVDAAAGEFAVSVDEDDALQDIVPIGQRSFLVLTLVNAGFTEIASIPVRLIDPGREATDETLRPLMNNTGPTTITINFRGPTGATGPEGDRGVQGPSGPMGPVGPSGQDPPPSNGDVTSGQALANDTTSKPIVSFDPRAGLVRLVGDWPAQLPGIEVLVASGQSNNAVGATQPVTYQAINRVARKPFRFLMFRNVGLMGLASTDITTLDLTEFAAAYESGSETLFTALIEQLLDYEDRHGIPVRARLCLNVAAGGQAYNGLKKGTRSFSNMLAGIQSLADQFGSVHTLGVTVDHGEANSLDSVASYKADWQEYYDDMNSVVDGIPSITGEAAHIPLFFVPAPISVQDASGRGPLLAVKEMHAEAIASAANRRIWYAATRHQGLHGDFNHLYPQSQLEKGAEVGQSIGEILRTGNNGTFWMTGATRPGGNVIRVTTNAEYDLAIDTDKIPARAFYGFVVYDSSLVAEQTISSVAVDGTAIELTMVGVPAAGWQVDYALAENSPVGTGPGGAGNIRDTRSTTVVNLDHQMGLYKWLVPSTIPVT